MKSRLPLFTRGSDLETQERACFALQLVQIVENVGGSISKDLLTLFSEPLNPVASKAQRKVPVPSGLDLNTQIHTPPSSDDESDLEDYDDDDYPPVETLTGDMIDLPNLSKGSVASSSTPKRKRLQKVQIITTEEMPEDAVGSDSEEEVKDD